MNMDKKSLESVIGEMLSPQGFRKKGATWYRQTPAGLQILNLQKSTYGDQYFVNLCFVPEGTEVDGMPTPNENKCPIRIRLTSAFPDERTEIEAHFDLESQRVDAVQRTDFIKEILRSKVLPFFDRLRDLSNLKSAIQLGTFKGGAVNLAARKVLGINML